MSTRTEPRQTIALSCPVGMAPFLQQEVEALGYKPIRTRETGIEIKGTLEDCIRLNFWLRTAHRVHYMLAESAKITNPEQLYRWLSTMPWEKLIPDDGYLSVTSRIDHPTVRNTQFANVRVKDAVVDRIRSATGRRPDSGSNLNGTVLFLYWDKEEARIFLDTSGESLSRRGYRTEAGYAPMQESLAAAILMATRWAPGMHLINPMCGSGTLLLEGLMMAMNRPPASLRHDFGFMHLKGFNEDTYNAIRAEARQGVIREPKGRFIATDQDPDMVHAAQKNARTAGVDHLIEFQVCDFKKTPIPDGEGILLFNPPYGERMDNPDSLHPLYRSIGDFMKKKGGGKTGYIFTGNLDLAKSVGLRTSSRTRLFNSTIECRLLEYELFPPK
ncbi:MAG: class I SAM-dependent RNA methyltransferase [Balneolaceae bacterium]